MDDFVKDDKLSSVHILFPFVPADPFVKFFYLFIEFAGLVPIFSVYGSTGGMDWQTRDSSCPQCWSSRSVDTVDLKYRCQKDCVPSKPPTSHTHCGASWAVWSWIPLIGYYATYLLKNLALKSCCAFIPKCSFVCDHTLRRVVQRLQKCVLVSSCLFFCVSVSPRVSTWLPLDGVRFGIGDPLCAFAYSRALKLILKVDGRVLFWSGQNVFCVRYGTEEKKEFPWLRLSSVRLELRLKKELSTDDHVWSIVNFEISIFKR